MAPSARRRRGALAFILLAAAGFRDGHCRQDETEPAPGGSLHTAAPPWSESPDEQCDIETSGPICLGGQVLLPPSVQPGLAGYWSFDGSSAMDSSGNGNHGALLVTAGPSFVGQGSSASFRMSFLMIPAAEQLRLQDFAYTFWLYFVEHHDHHQSLAFCPLIRKGSDSAMQSVQESPAYASAPIILYNRHSQRLRVELATESEGGARSLEGFDSIAQLGRGRWFHVAVVRLDGQRQTRLYVNGVLDTSQITRGFTLPNDDPLYVGSDPVARHQCDIPVYIDELKVYNRSLMPDEIQAEAAPALAGIEPSFLRLACVNCPLETAVENCPDGYHICNSLELHMGGYQVARSLGWLDKSTHVWSHSPTANAALQGHSSFGHFSPQQPQTSAVTPAPAPAEATPHDSEPCLGLGICCADDVGAFA